MVRDPIAVGKNGVWLSKTSCLPIAMLLLLILGSPLCLSEVHQAFLPSGVNYSLCLFLLVLLGPLGT